MEINQYDITMATHYDTTMDNHIARNAHCEIAMGNDVASDIHCDMTMSNDVVMSIFCYVFSALCLILLFYYG